MVSQFKAKIPGVNTAHLACTLFLSVRPKMQL